MIKRDIQNPVRLLCQQNAYTSKCISRSIFYPIHPGCFQEIRGKTSATQNSENKKVIFGRQNDYKIEFSHFRRNIWDKVKDKIFIKTELCNHSELAQLLNT